MSLVLSESEAAFASRDVDPIDWFLDLGIAIFPTANKIPALPAGTSWLHYAATRQQARSWTEYAVPLGHPFGVVDTDSEAAEAWAESYVPPIPFVVRTGRGRHRYFRLTADVPHVIHRNGLAIELRRRGQFVVGPASVRPDGVRYIASDWSWDLDDVPSFPVADFLFDDRPASARAAREGAFTLPEIISPSERHATLHKLMRSLRSWRSARWGPARLPPRKLPALPSAP